MPGPFLTLLMTGSSAKQVLLKVTEIRMIETIDLIKSEHANEAQI